jgi:hypothetical protein
MTKAKSNKGEIIMNRPPVNHLKPGDYVEAEFQELGPDTFNHDHSSGMIYVASIGLPTGRTYMIKGRLYQATDPGAGPNTLNIKEGFKSQCIRQSNGSPGGWLVAIHQHESSQTNE